MTGDGWGSRRTALAIAAFILVMTVICVIAGLDGRLDP